MYDFLALAVISYQLCASGEWAVIPYYIINNIIYTNPNNSNNTINIEHPRPADIVANNS